MITINTDNITLIHSERGPSGYASPKFSISDIHEDEDGDPVRTVTFSFDIIPDDRWSLSVSKGIGDEKVAFGFGQGSTHQERPECVLAKANEWQKEEDKKLDEKLTGAIRFPTELIK